MRQIWRRIVDQLGANDGADAATRIPPKSEPSASLEAELRQRYERC